MSIFLPPIFRDSTISISFCHTDTSTGEGVLIYGSLDLSFPALA